MARRGSGIAAVAGRGSGAPVTALMLRRARQRGHRNACRSGTDQQSK